MLAHGHVAYTHHHEGAVGFVVEMDVECQLDEGRFHDLDVEKSRIELLEVSKGWRPAGISEVTIEREATRWVCHGNVLMELCPGPMHVPLLATHVRLRVTLLPDGTCEPAAPVVKVKALKL